jgi:DNA-binding PadR family transcriptional regulator
MTLSTSRLAILAALSSGERSAYELAKLFGRPVRFFWTKAESGTYADLRRLEADAMVQSRVESTGGRDRTIYSLSEQGRATLRGWLESEPTEAQYNVEAMLRLYLADAGTVEDLQRSVAGIGRLSEAMIEDALAIADGYVLGRHERQRELALRALEFSLLWAQGSALRSWVVATEREISRWKDLDGDEESRRRALATMGAAIRSARENALPARG